MELCLCSRLVKEYNDIQVKIKTLIQFINSEEYQSDCVEDQHLALKQIEIMQQYAAILKQRVAIVCKK